MDQKIFRVRRNGDKYEVVETIIYDSGQFYAHNVVFTDVSKAYCELKAEQMNKDGG